MHGAANERVRVVPGKREIKFALLSIRGNKRATFFVEGQKESGLTKRQMWVL